MDGVHDCYLRHHTKTSTEAKPGVNLLWFSKCWRSGHQNGTDIRHDNLRKWRSISHAICYGKEWQGSRNIACYSDALLPTAHKVVLRWLYTYSGKAVFLLVIEAPLLKIISQASGNSAHFILLDSAYIWDQLHYVSYVSANSRSIVFRSTWE